MTRDMTARPLGERHLGRAIRGLRRDRHLTLTQFSERSGLSLPFLSQVENNRARPSGQSLSLIAAALDCVVADIVVAAKAERIIDVDRAPVQSGDADRALVPSGGPLHVSELTKSPGEGQDWQTHLHEVVLYVVRGAVIVATDSVGAADTHVLHAGDRIRCGGGVRYRWQADGGEAVVIAVRSDDRTASPRL